MPQNVIAYILSRVTPEHKYLGGFELCQTINEAQKQLPVGVYTTFRTYQKTKALNLDDHFSRLTESAMLLGYSVSLDRVKIRRSIRAILDQLYFSENRIRLSLDLSIFPGDIYILIESLTTPDAEAYELGVSVCTRVLHRDQPKVKSTEFIELADRERHSLAPGVNEIIMIGAGGRMLEGLSSNFFAIKDGAVWTEEENVLSGITRKVVLTLIGEMGIEVVLEGFAWQKQELIDEAFLTSASRGVLPVTIMDGQPVGDGKPGEMTVSIMKEFNMKIDHLPEEI